MVRVGKSLVLLVLIVVVGLVRIKLNTRSPASKAPGLEQNWWWHVVNQHVLAALLLSFVVLPAASAKIFRVLTPCLEPLPDGTRLHRADLAVSCESDSYYRAVATAVVMIFVYPLGVPLTYAILLYHFRDKIRPRNCDRLDALRQRNADLALRPISFLFSCYSPDAFYFEIFDS